MPDRMSRIIMHIDMNSYFASVEQQANPFLRGKPIGVTGKRQTRSVVAAASREAKVLGVKTAMASWKAKEICPSLELVMGDPEKYSEITRRFNDILERLTDKVERFSVDESFVDLTEIARDYDEATSVAKDVKRRLRETCGEWVTASVGIAPNKLLAKLSAERVKPDGLTVTRPHQVLDLLNAVELEDICGIGPRIGRRLRAMGISNTRQLRTYPVEKLVQEFHSYGAWLHDAAHGRDSSPVLSGEADPKSFSHSYTLPRNTYSEKEIKRVLLALADRVAWRMRRDGFAARCVSAYVRYGDFSGDGHQCRASAPLRDGLDLFDHAWGVLKPRLHKRKPVRLLGIAASELTRGTEQQSLFVKEQKMSSVLHALDDIQHRYGSRSWTRASLVNVEFKERSSGFHYDEF